MFAVRRAYLVVLVLAGLLAVCFVVVPKITSSIHAREAREALVAANASFAQLKVPGDFVALKSDPDCLSYPCYRVPRPTTSVAAQLPAIFKSTGAQAVGTVRQSCFAGDVCNFGGFSHGYQVLIFLNTYLACSANQQCHARRNQSIVSITPPYIPADSEPWNGGSGWPVN